MASLNRVQLIGIVEKDVELRYTPSGRPVASLTLSVERDEVVQSTRLDTVADSLGVLAWGKLAETCNKQLRRGDPIYLEGYLISPKFQLTTAIHDDEFGDDVVDMTDSLVQLTARRIEFLTPGTSRQPFPANKEKICEAMTYLEGAQEGLRALQILGSIDLETID